MRRSCRQPRVSYYALLSAYSMFTGLCEKRACVLSGELHGYKAQKEFKTIKWNFVRWSRHVLRFWILCEHNWCKQQNLMQNSKPKGKIDEHRIKWYKITTALCNSLWENLQVLSSWYLLHASNGMRVNSSSIAILTTLKAIYRGEIVLIAARWKCTVFLAVDYIANIFVSVVVKFAYQRVNLN